MLREQDRLKLDGIVGQMTANKESEDNIRFVVDDFKKKYEGRTQPINLETPEVTKRQEEIYAYKGKPVPEGQKYNADSTVFKDSFGKKVGRFLTPKSLEDNLGFRGLTKAEELRRGESRFQNRIRMSEFESKIKEQIKTEPTAPSDYKEPTSFTGSLVEGVKSGYYGTLKPALGYFQESMGHQVKSREMVERGKRIGDQMTIDFMKKIELQRPEDMADFLGGGYKDKRYYGRVIGETVAFMGTIITTSITGAIVGGGAGAYIGFFGSAKAIEQGNAYKSMLDAGMAPDDASLGSDIYGTASALIEGSLGITSKVAENTVSREGRQIIAKSFNDYLLEAIPQIIKKSGKQVFEEGGEEVAQEITQRIITDWWTKEEDIITTDLVESFVSGVIGSAPFTVLNIPAYKKDVSVTEATNQAKETLDELSIDDKGDPLNTLAEVSQDKPQEVEEKLTEIQKRDISEQEASRAKSLLEEGSSRTETILELSGALGIDEATQVVEAIAPEIEAKVAKEQEQAQAKQDKVEKELDTKIEEAKKEGEKTDIEKSIDELTTEVEALKKEVKDAKPKSKEKATLKTALEAKRKAIRYKRVVEKEEVTAEETSEEFATRLEFIGDERVRDINTLEDAHVDILENGKESTYYKHLSTQKTLDKADTDLLAEYDKLIAKKPLVKQTIQEKKAKDKGKVKKEEKPKQEKPTKEVDKKVDKKEIISKTKTKYEKRTDKDTGTKPDGKGVSKTLPMGKDKPKDTSGKGRKTKEDGQPTDTSGKPDEDTGKRLGTELTNEEVAKIVEAVTEISNTGEVLLVGEVTEELKEQANQYKTGGVAKEGRGILDEYYTDKKIVEAVGSVLNFPFSPIKVLEPAVGAGNFLYALPDTKGNTVVAHEINDTTSRITKIFHPDATVYNNSFETTFIDDRGNKKDFESDYDFVIGNPPYGEHRGKYLGLGEESGIKKYEDYFIKRGLDVLKKGGTLAMVVPSSFLRTGENSTKLEISAVGNLVNAFRLPVGVFEGTDIGTDIVIFKRRDPQKDLTDLVSIVNDNFFKENPDNILGTTKKKKNRFGKMEDVVFGTLEDALNIIEERNKQSEAKHLVEETKEDITEENVAEAEDVIEENRDKPKAEQKKKLKKKIAEDKKAKKVIEKKVKVKAVKQKKGIKSVPLDSFFKSEYTQEELNAWADTQQDGSLANPQGHNDSIINFYNGKWYNDFNYAQGDIYQKLERLDIDLNTDKINKDQHSKQKAKLEAVLPKREDLKDITLSPDHNFLGQLDMETGVYELRTPEYKDGKLQAPRDVENSMRTDFSEWLNELPNGAFGESSIYEVRSFMKQIKVTGNDALRNESERRRRRRIAENLMTKYLSDLSTEKKQIVEDAYNEVYNSYYTPDYSQVPMTAQVNYNMWSLKDSQKAGVGRLISQGKGLLAHEVGFGKTLSGVLTVQELLSKGWAKKPLIVVPKSVTKQWIEDTILNFLPDANVNYLGNLSKGFVKDLSSIQIEEGSISVITHEGFKKLGFKEETYSSLVSKFGYISSPQLGTERKRQKQKEKDEETKGVGMKGTRADLTFEELGFDAIVLDEAHKANHIVARAQPPEGKGGAWGSGSGSDFTQMPSQMGIKTWLASQYIQQQNNGNNTFLLSATPFTNKPIEFYSILSMIGNERLERMGFSDVNSFFGMFFEQEVRDEFTGDGKYVTKTRIRRIKNFRQWRQLLGSMVDFRLEDETVIRPNKIERNIHIPPNDLTKGYFSQAQGIFQDTDRKARALVGIGEVQKIGFSPYSKHEFAGELPTDYKKIIENSPKLFTVVKMVGQNLKDNPNGGQIIYSEVGVEMFPLIKEYLVKETGLKKEQVEIITGSTPSGSGDVKDAKRKKIQDDLNSGKVKVLLGSTAIQVGMNLQETTTDMHILSLPWNFLDLRQVYGRAWRQGNQWANVRMTHYLMEDSGDIHRSQSLANKQRLYDSAIQKDANEVDISDIDHEEEALSLVSDPRRKAEMQISGEVKLLDVKKDQLKADLAFSTRKIEKITKLDENIKDNTERLKEEKIKYEKDLKEDPENASDFWVNSYEKDIKRDKKARQEELDKLAEKGIDIKSLLEKSALAQKEIEETEASIKELNETLEARVDKLTKELPPPKVFDDKFIESLLEERKEDNKTFYSEAKEETVDTVTVETVEKPIKSRSGKVIKVKKKTKAVVKKKTAPKKATKDQELLKVLTDDKLTVAEKVDTLLGKKQEGKKFKDVGERVAGSKKENSIIQAVIQHGDDALLKQLANELGTDPLIAQLNKQKILEDVAIPTRETEIKAKTPAWIAGYKVKVFNTIGKTPTIIQKTGRYGSQTIVLDDTIDNFIAKYPQLLKNFVNAINAIKDIKTLKAFQGQYGFTFAEIKDNEGEPAHISIEVIGKTMRNAIRGGGKFIKDTRNVLWEIERLELVKEVLDKGFKKEEGKFILAGGKELNATYRGMDDWGNRTTVYETQAEAEAMTKKYKKDNPDAIKEIDEELEKYTTDYDRFVPEKTGGVSKQIKEAEAKIKRFKENLQYSEDALKDPEDGVDKKFRQEQIDKTKEEIKKTEEFVARLKGETKAITHGNFEEISEYDVKDSRFKKADVTVATLMNKYGFKSAQLGNYMDDVSSHDHTVQTMGAMEDMSTILGVDFSVIANKFGLSIAFGARGGGNYNAHYEPTHNIINLTKKRGDGSFGHEFMHFLDWQVGKETSSGKLSGAVSRRYYQRTDIGKTADLITEALRNGITLKKDKTFKPDKDVESYRFKRVAQWRNEDKFSFEDALNRAKANRQELLQAVADVYRKEFTVSVGKTSNEYYKKSKEYGGGSDTSYWVKSHELWARAFQAYLQDKLEASDIKNNYLTRNTKDISVYPQGEERVEYNKLFDSLFEALAVEYKPEEDIKAEPRFKLKDRTGVLVVETGYKNVANNLMGFSGDGKEQKGFVEQNYKYVLPVKVEFSDGTIIYDEIKGLNKPHASERAKRNWAGAKIYALKREGADFKFKGTETHALTDGGNFLEDVKRRLKIDFDVQFVDNILVSGNREAYGVTYDNTIALVKDLSDTTAQHEVVHLTLANMSKIDAFKGVTSKEVLIAKAEQLGITYSDKTRSYIEEKLAQDFEAYVAKKHESTGKVKAFFEKLLAMLRSFANAVVRTKGDIIKDYYDVLLTGKSVNQEMIRLENNGVIESFVEEGVLDTYDMVSPTFYDKITLKFKDLALGDFDLDNAKEDVSRGLTSQTKLPMLVEWDSNIGKYFLKDGHHRLVEAWEKGKKQAVFDVVPLKFKLKEEKTFRDLKVKHNKSINQMQLVEAKLNENRVKLSKALKLREMRKDVLDGKIDSMVVDLKRNLTKEGVLSVVGEKKAEELGYNPKEVNVVLNDYLKAKTEFEEVKKITIENKSLVSELRKDSKTIKLDNKEVARRLLFATTRLKELQKSIKTAKHFGRDFVDSVEKVRTRQLREIVAISKIAGQKTSQLVERALDETIDWRKLDDKEFIEFVSELTDISQQAVGKELVRIDIYKIIAENKLNKIDNLRIVLGYPKVRNMTKVQLKNFKEILNKYKEGDTFLSQGLLNTIDNTDWAGVRTIRELAEKVDLPVVEVESLYPTKIDETLPDYNLSKKNPYYGFVVELKTKELALGRKKYVEFKIENEELLTKARKSRRKNMTFIKKVIDVLVPTDELIVDYMEIDKTKEDKVTKYLKDNPLTKEELEYAKFLEYKFGDARVYLERVEAMTTRFGNQNYVTHLRKGFLESIKNNDVKTAFKQMFSNWSDEKQMAEILADTQGILKLSKFFSKTLFRTGEMLNSQNLGRISNEYFKGYYTKVALDAIMPKAVAVAQMLDDTKVQTETGLVQGRKMRNFIVDYLNTAKGRKKELLVPQGSIVDKVISGIVVAIYVKFLAYAIAINVVSFLGEFSANFSNMNWTQRKNMLTRLMGLFGKKKLWDSALGITGESPVREVLDQGNTIVEVLYTLGFIGFSSARYTNDKLYLLGVATKEEYEAGSFTKERIGELDLLMSKTRVRPNKASIAGSSVESKTIKIFYGWALPVIFSAVNDVKTFVNSKGKNKESGMNIVRVMEGAVFAYFLVLLLQALKPEKCDSTDKYSVTCQIFNKANREVNFLFQAFTSPFSKDSRGEVRIPFVFYSQLLQFSTALANFGEQYKEDGYGFEIGEDKGVRKMKRFVTPTALGQFGIGFDFEKRDTKVKLINEAIESGEFNPEEIAKTIYAEDWANQQKKTRSEKKQKEYKKNKLKEIEALYNIKKKFSGDADLVSILDDGGLDNEEKITKIKEYEKETGKKVFKTMVLLKTKRKYCTGYQKGSRKTLKGCLVSQELIKEYKKAN